MFLVGDIVKHENNVYRVVAHIKRVEDTLDSWVPSSYKEQIVKNIAVSAREYERSKRKSSKLPCNKRYRFAYCYFDEAEYVELVGTDSKAVPVSECKKIGIVDWSITELDDARRNAVTLIYTQTICWDWE
jgi:hypothetical protein